MINLIGPGGLVIDGGKKNTVYIYIYLSNGEEETKKKELKGREEETMTVTE